MSIVRHNWHWKLIALILSVILNVYVHKKQDVLRRTITVPVTVQAPPGQRTLEPAPGFQVFVDLEGPDELVRAIEPREVTISFDTSAVPAGRRVSVPIEVVLPERYRRVVTSTRPIAIPVHFAAEVTRVFPVVVQTRSSLEGWTWRIRPKPDPGDVRVSGPDSIVARIAQVLAPLTLQEREAVEDFVAVEARDATGALVTGVRIEPLQVLVTGVQERVVVPKRVLVQVALDLPRGMRAELVDVAPSQVRLVGPAVAVRDVFQVDTQQIRVTPQPALQTHEVSLVPPAAGMELTPARVKVTLRVIPLANPAGEPE